jgi:hypothetical protein
MRLSCDSRWSDEAVYSFGVIEYPDLLAVQTTTAMNEQIEYFQGSPNRSSD